MGSGGDAQPHRPGPHRGGEHCLERGSERRRPSDHVAIEVAMRPRMRRVASRGAQPPPYLKTGVGALLQIHRGSRVHRGSRQLRGRVG